MVEKSQTASDKKYDAEKIRVAKNIKAVLEGIGGKLGGVKSARDKLMSVGLWNEQNERNLIERIIDRILERGKDYYNKTQIRVAKNIKATSDRAEFDIEPPKSMLKSVGLWDEKGENKRVVDHILDQESP